MSSDRPEHVRVYGGDHSPWVQALLLGLHEKGIPHTVVTVPPLSVFLNSGILMPAASLDGGPWHLGSGEILGQLGFSKVSSEDTLDLARALVGGPHRVDSGPRFWYRWSFVRDHHRSFPRRLLNHFLRSFSVLYFYLTLKSLALGHKPLTPEGFRRQFLVWERKLEQSEGPFLAGEKPDTIDLQLFGGIQCHCSIPDPVIPVLQADPALPRLRAWIAAMQQRFSDYRHLYSGPLFEPHLPMPEPAPLLERIVFWCGSGFMIAAFPITVPLWFYYQHRVRSTGMIGLPIRRARGASPSPSPTEASKSTRPETKL